MSKTRIGQGVWRQHRNAARRAIRVMRLKNHERGSLMPEGIRSEFRVFPFTLHPHHVIANQSFPKAVHFRKEHSPVNRTAKEAASFLIAEPCRLQAHGFNGEACKQQIAPAQQQFCSRLIDQHAGVDAR